MRFPNGYGTVYKLSGNRRRPWIARVTVGWKAVKGKSRQYYKTIGYFKKDTEALDALVKYRNNPVPIKANMTLEEVYKEWSKTKYEYISKSTQEGYQAGWSRLSKYKNIKFTELRTSHLQSIIDVQFKAGQSRSTLSKIKIVAGMLYQYAIENDLLNKNYAEFIKLPKMVKEEKEIFTDIEIQKIENGADTIPWLETILILIYTGMRISELLGLTRFNVNMESGIITGGIKTDAGKNRTIPIHPKIYKYIQKWYDKKGDYLICDNNGKQIGQRRYREDYYLPALKAVEVRKLNPHSCRHTFASLLSKAGAKTIAIQKLCGHADYALTADVYTHTDIEELKKAISLL